MYLLLFVLWVAIMAFPVVAFRLAREGEINVGQTRVFLVDEGNQEGIGFATVRQMRGDPPCRRTTINYIMWRGETDNNRSCSCDAAGKFELQGRQCVLVSD